MIYFIYLCKLAELLYKQPSQAGLGMKVLPSKQSFHFLPLTPTSPASPPPTPPPSLYPKDTRLPSSPTSTPVLRLGKQPGKPSPTPTQSRPSELVDLCKAQSDFPHRGPGWPPSALSSSGGALENAHRPQRLVIICTHGCPAPQTQSSSRLSFLSNVAEIF